MEHQSRHVLEDEPIPYHDGEIDEDSIMMVIWHAFEKPKFINQVIQY
jgi:hypothetical protein